MTVEDVRDKYRSVAGEYISRLGRIEAMDDDDRRDIAEWATALHGPVLDAGSGPGHWTAFLADQGVEAEGIDVVDEFVQAAAAHFPHVRYRVGELAALPHDDASLAGILSWYSIIHTEPQDVPTVLTEFARALQSKGALLLGYFEGAEVVPFDHAVTTAWFWSFDALSSELESVGFTIDRASSRADEGLRQHGAIWARKR